MGWGRTLLLGDIGNRMDIEDTEYEIKRLKGKIERSVNKNLTQDQKIDRLVAENNELKLYLAALVRLLTSNGTILPENLKAMVDVIDSADGTADGKYDGDIV